MASEPSPGGVAVSAGSPAAADPDRLFSEFRRKVRDSELLSASMERLLASLRFTGRLSIVLQNGQVLKSGYEEGYFHRRNSEP